MDQVEDSRPLRCTACGSSALEAGFLYNRAQYSGGRDLWVSGAPDMGVMGKPRGLNARRTGYVVVFRCRDCWHLEHYVPELRLGP
ncbi:hypothetical protein [Actinospica robiniae]|uniref:hypothetical protein n=1 Tax=Actinospica robiniae TaxID=304901 RepID=UPI0012FBCB8A|nr:hypothetical protein [Actinospica robiniae]